MSLIAAIDTAVRLQLVRDGAQHYADYRRVMGPDIAAAGGLPAVPGLGFDKARFEIFLQKVARRLKFDTPPLNYDWTKTDAEKCLTADREVVIELIAAATTEISETAKD